VVSGFEPVDIMQSILMLVKQIEAAKPKVEIQYQRVVPKAGKREGQETYGYCF